MASHGKVLDLFDDRYLNLQDVFGRVEPLPSLVPYEQYTQAALVYRIDTNHEVYMALLQDFTDRFARQQESKEAWTWCVQWEVEKSTTETQYAPSAKKQRRDIRSATPQNDKPSRQKGPAYTRIERRLLHPELFQEEDMLRILIDIVQVDSKFVPNYIEFLYQWVDYYEGGGRALKAALRMEIPSLWLFEFHPRPLFNNDSKDKEEDGLNKAAEEMGEKFTKRKKPLALEEMERLTEQSERLQYREVKFGIQRPIDIKDEPLPPLINIPHDHNKRQQYYAACFKNRQRAFWLLQEAGVTARQVANYKKLQPMNPKETVEDINGDGFLNYYKEEPYAHAVFVENQRVKELREKQREIAISNRLAEEARLASMGPGQASSRLPPALIPPRPAFPPAAVSGNPETLAAWLAMVKSRVNVNRDPPIKAVPKPMFGKPKSKVFSQATARQYPPPHTHWMDTDSDDTSEDSDDDDDDDDSIDPDDIDPDEREDADAMDTTPSAPPPNPLPPLGIDVLSHIPDYLRSLSPVRLAGIMPVLSPEAQAGMRRQYPELFPAPPPGFERQVAALGPFGLTFGVPPQGPPPPPPGSGPGATASGPFGGSSLGVAPQVSISLHNSTFPPSTIPQIQQPLHTQTQVQGVSSVYAGTPVFGASTLGTGSLQAQPQGGANSRNLMTTTAGAHPVPSSLPHPQAPYNIRAPPVPQQATQGIQHAPGGMAGTGSLQSTQPGDIAHLGHGQNGAAQQAPIPALTSMQAQREGSRQGHDVPRGISPALQALFEASARNAPSRMMALTRNQPAQNQEASNTPRPAPSPAGFPLLTQPAGYGSLSSSPVTQSFRQMMAARDRDRPRPSLYISSSEANQHSSSGACPGHTHSIPMTPLARLAGNLSLTSPQTNPFQHTSLQAASPHGLPIQIYLPKVIIPHGRKFAEATDCLLLGYTRPGNGILTLSKAIFFPTSIWDNMLRRVRRDHAEIIEAFAAPPNHPRKAAFNGTLQNPDDVKGPHKFVYDKLTQIFKFMCVDSDGDREEEVTKRWRVTPGQMRAKMRGAVWEGWAVYVDRPVEMGYEERHGVGNTVHRSLDGRKGFGLTEEEMWEKERITREIDEMIAEDEANNDSEEGEVMEE